MTNANQSTGESAVLRSCLAAIVSCPPISCKSSLDDRASAISSDHSRPEADHSTCVPKLITALLALAPPAELAELAPPAVEPALPDGKTIAVEPALPDGKAIAGES